MNSMTGYGRGSAENGRGIVTAELKSVNSRFLEINMRSDHFSAFLEDRASRKIKETLHRGKVTVYLSFQPSAEGRNLKVVLDRNLLSAYAAALTEGRRMKGLKNRKPSISDLLTLPEPFLHVEKEVLSDEELAPLVDEAMEKALVGELTEAQSPLQVSVERDVEPTISAIKSFIEDYNKLVGDLNGKYYEKAYRTYTPLTEEQRREMSEKEAELWDEKAKSGILRNDSTIGSLLTNLRSALAVKVGDTGMSAYDIGISTVAWKTDSWRTEQGKLQLDESKLRAALEKDPDAVQKVLSAVSTGSDGTADTSVSSVNGTQKSEAGLFTRMNAFFTSFNSTMRSKNIVNEQKSISNYTEKLSEMLTKMSEKEEKYWAQFSKLETALSEMQSQQSWLSSQLGLSA